jgi:hypothetical protein
MATAETEAASSHSGKLLVRMPRTLHAELAAAADREGVSLNAFIVGALGGAVAWRSDAPPAGAAAPPVVAPNGQAPSPPDGATSQAAPRAAAPSRTLSVALVVNLVVVVLAAAAAVALVIAAWPG